MEGKFFLLDKGHVVVRNSEGKTASFDTVAQFNKYYSGSIDLSGEYYICYEPEARLFYYNNDPKSAEPLTNLYDQTPEVPEYEAVIADLDNMVGKLHDPFFSLDLTEAKAYKLQAIKGETFRTIAAHLPQWKQAKWREFIRIHEKHLEGQPLTRLEQATYDNFPNNSESADFRYKKVVKAFEWIIECVAVNDKKESELRKAKSIDAIRKIKDASYPSWPLEQKGTG